jgi:urease accessory protein
MIHCDSVLGNAADPPWPERLAGARISELRLDAWRAQKHRLRQAADDGTEVALSLDRGSRLRDGDVLLWRPDDRWAVVARVAPSEVLHIELEPDEPERVAERAIKLGHVLGNQHWPALARGRDVYVPLAVDRRVMEAVLRTHAIAGIRFAFEPAGDLDIPYVAPSEHGHGPAGPEATPVASRREHDAHGL